MVRLGDSHINVYADMHTSTITNTSIYYEPKLSLSAGKLCHGKNYTYSSRNKDKVHDIGVHTRTPILSLNVSLFKQHRICDIIKGRQFLLAKAGYSRFVINLSTEHNIHYSAKTKKSKIQSIDQQNIAVIYYYLFASQDNI